MAEGWQDIIAPGSTDTDNGIPPDLTLIGIITIDGDGSNGTIDQVRWWQTGVMNPGQSKFSIYASDRIFTTRSSKSPNMTKLAAKAAKM